MMYKDTRWKILLEEDLGIEWAWKNINYHKNIR